MKEKIMRIFELCLEIQQNNGQLESRKAKESNKPCVFFNYSGHVNCIRMCIYENGWAQSNENPDFYFNIYLNYAEDEKIADECLEKLEEILEELKEEE